MTALFLILISVFAPAAAQAMDYILSDEGKKIPISPAYTVSRLIFAVDDAVSGFSKPTDLAVGRDDCLYVLDAGNNRVVKMNGQGETLAVFTDFGESGVTGATGLCVDRYNEIYIADAGNMRVVHVSAEGRFVEQFVRPESALLDTATYPFLPTKVAVDALGYLNVLSGQDYHGIISIDGDNEFRGYVGTNKVGYDLTNAIVYLFATDQQKEQLSKTVPAYFSNICFDESGYYYTTVAFSPTYQIKKLNAVGVNILANNQEKAYGEGGINAQLTDLTVDSNGIITAVDKRTGMIYQYDQEGNLLCAFGGTGSVVGKFSIPVAIDGDSRFNLYVLDQERGMIQVFERTRFMALVHEGIRQYNGGDYERSYQTWTQVLEADSTYLLAYIHMGNVLYKQKKWTDSMKMYQLAKDKAHYSRAFEAFKKEQLQKWFVPVVVGAGAIAYLLYRLLIRAGKRAREIVLQGVNGPC